MYSIFGPNVVKCTSRPDYRICVNMENATNKP